MDFRYRAFNQHGEIIEGIVSGASLKEAKKSLKAQGLLPLEVVPLGSEGIFSRGKLGDFELYRIFSQLSLLLKSGVNIDNALILCKETFREKHIKSVLEKIIQDLRAGKEVHRAFHETTLFPPLIVTFIKIGEKTGKLREAFSNIAEYLLFQQKLKRELTNALIYPVFLITASILVLLGVVKLILPRFFSLFTDNIESLPLLSRVLYSISLSLSFESFLIVFISVVIVYPFRHHSVIKKAGLALKSVFLKIPFIHSLLLDLDLARLSLSLNHMLRSGLEFYQALSFATELVSLHDLRESLRNTLPLLREGKTITEALSTVPHLPPFLIGAIKVGEESGRLDEVFGEMYLFFSDRFQNTVKRMITLLEPLIITVVGIVVGLIVISLILTVMNVSQLKF